MAITVSVVSQKWFNEYKNDVGFASNPSDYALNFTGSVMEKVKVVTQIDIRWNRSSSASEIWGADTSLGTITKNTGSWLTDGFSVGDYCAWLQNGVITAYITITAISQGGLEIYYNLESGSITDSNNAALIGLTPLEALVYEFGINTTGESYNNLSKISNNSQGYYSGTIGLDIGGGIRDTTFQQLQKLGVFDDWITGTAKARFLSNPTYDIQRFEIEHEFMINPYYLDGELSNLQNLIPPQILSGNNTLNYVYNPEFRASLSNPNTAKSILVDNDIGAVAWYDENFNGFNVDYKINSISYIDQASLGAASGLLIGSKTRVTFELEALNRNFVIGDKVGFFISYLPEQNEYTNTTLSNVQDNFIYDNAFQLSGTAGAVVSAEGLIDYASISNPAGNLITCVFDVEYLPLQKAFLSGKFNTSPIYFNIGVQIGDISLTTTSSDRVILLADVELYDQSPDISDLMHVTKNDIYPHNQQIGVGNGFSDMVSWNEDGLVVDFEFDLNLNLSAFLNSLDFKLVAFNTLTEQYWELDSYAFSPATSVVSGGVQQIISNTTRNYILESGDQFNDVIINVGSQAAGLQKYSGRFAQKISWQDWILNNATDTIFFDAAEPNNNFNDKASNYSLINDYEIRLAILGNVSGTSPLGISGLTDYLFLSPNITVYDYEKDGLEPPVWTCSIETFDAVNMTPLNGSVLSGIDTLFRCTWTSINAPITSLADIWGINRIEITNQPGYEITEMSSLNLPLPTGQQLLKPSLGTLLDVTLVGGNVVMECLIDGSLVATGTNYNLSSRIQHDVTPSEGKVTSPLGISKDTSGTVVPKSVAP
tara:strand:+ start:3217 stop:5685 length:2469 start_codon:yes stop_codon:yes gene_type:complete